MSLVYTLPEASSAAAVSITATNKKRRSRRNSLYIGGRAEAKSLEKLTQWGISHILNVTPAKETSIQSGVPNFFEKSQRFVYKRVPVYDAATSATQLEQQAESIVTFISNGLFHGSVFIHCQHGISRSATCAMMYLIRKCHNTVDEALTILRRRRPQVQPIPSFINMLQRYQRSCESMTNDDVIVNATSSRGSIATTTTKSTTAANDQTTTTTTTTTRPNKRQKHDQDKSSNMRMIGPSIGPSLPPSSSTTRIGPSLPSSSPIGPTVATTNLIGPTVSASDTIGPSLPTTTTMGTLSCDTIGPNLPATGIMGTLSSDTIGPTLPTTATMGTLSSDTIGPNLPTTTTMGTSLTVSSSDTIGPSLPTTATMGTLSSDTIGPSLPATGTMGTLSCDTIGPSLPTTATMGSSLTASSSDTNGP